MAFNIKNMNKHQAIEIAITNLPDVSSSETHTIYQAISKPADLVSPLSVYPSETSYFTVGFTIHFNHFGICGWRLIEAF